MHFFLFHLGLQVFMASETEVWALCQKEFVQFCLVRTVALCAFIRQQRLVLAFCSLKSFAHIIVARETERSLFVYDHPSDIASMGIVTGKTLPLCKGVMVRAARLRFHEIVVTLGAHLGARNLRRFFSSDPWG